MPWWVQILQSLTLVSAGADVVTCQDPNTHVVHAPGWMCCCRILFLFSQWQHCRPPARSWPVAGGYSLTQLLSASKGRCLTVFPSYGPEKHASSIFYSLSCNHKQQTSTRAKALQGWVPAGFGVTSRGRSTTKALSGAVSSCCQ